MLPTDPWCHCLGLWQHQSVPGDLSHWRPESGVEMAEMELFRMPYFPFCCVNASGAWSREKLQHRLFPSWIGVFPGGAEQGAGCCSLSAGTEGPLCCAPMASSVWEPLSQTLHSSTECGGAQGAPQPGNPLDFRLMEKIAPSSRDHLISST